MLEIIATFILIYLFFRMFVYYILPWLLRRWVNRAQKKFYEQNPHLDPQARAEKASQAGTASKQSHKLDDIGEYVDFEEIKEK